MDEFMSVEQIAGRLAVSKKTVYRHLARGSIPATRIGRQWRFDKTSIDEWLRRKSIGGEANILVIDDEDVIRELFKDILGKLGYRVLAVKHGSQGLQLVKQSDFDVVFLDLKLPGIDGAEVLREIRAIKPRLRVVIITGYPDSEIMARALAQGPFEVMKKPFDEGDIIAAVDALLPPGRIEEAVKSSHDTSMRHRHSAR